jgi:MYXO-CTERM domain-containing protein
MRTAIALLAFACVGALALLDARDAHACSPAQPGMHSTMPADGGTHPANGIVLFFGFGFTLDATVTVDGAAAALVPAGDFPAGIAGGMGARVEPEPTEGQEVVITGDFCSDADLEQGSGCEMRTIRFTAAARDETTPAAPATTFDVYDYPDFHSGGGDCMSDSDLAWFVHIDGAAPEPGGAPMAHLVEGLAPGRSEVVMSRVVFVDEASVDVTFHATSEALGGNALAEAMCFRVTTFDAAGHQSAVSDAACMPCHLRDESGDDGDDSSRPDEPSWNDDDIYEDGPCADGSGGCSCRAARTSGSSGWLALAGAFVLAAARAWGRRRRR